MKITGSGNRLVRPSWLHPWPLDGSSWCYRIWGHCLYEQNPQIGRHPHVLFQKNPFAHPKKEGSLNSFWSNYSDLTRPHLKWWFSKGNPLLPGKSGLVKYYNLARFLELNMSIWALKSLFYKTLPSREQRKKTQPFPVASEWTQNAGSSGDANFWSGRTFRGAGCRLVWMERWGADFLVKYDEICFLYNPTYRGLCHPIYGCFQK